MDIPPDQEYLTPREVAKILGFTRTTIYAYLKDRTIPAVKFKNEWRIHRKWLEEVEKECYG